MKKLLLSGCLILTLTAVTPLCSIAQDKDHGKRGVGPAPFYISIKDKIGITKEQEEKLTNIEKDSMKKLDDITPALMKTQQSLNALTREDEVDLNKTRELLNNMVKLETDGRFIVIETMVLENKVLSKEQRDKAKGIAIEMSKGAQPTPQGNK